MIPPMEEDVTAGGIPLYRHRRRLTDEPSMSRGDRALIEAMHDHLERCFHGWDGLVLHEKISPTVHLDVMVVRPTAVYPCLRLVTCGVAELPVHVPPDWSETPYAELSIALPPSWPVSMDAFRDERFYWPVRLLKHLGRMPHDGQTFLWTGHTIHGNRSQPYAPDTHLCASLIVAPLIAPREFGEFKVGGELSVRLLGVLPIYAEELEVKLHQTSARHIETQQSTSQLGESDRLLQQCLYCPVSKNPGDEAPADFGAIFLVAGKILCKKLFFVRQSPNKAKNGENGRDEIPIGAKCESHGNKEDRSTRIHGVSYHCIGSRGDHFLVLDDLNG